jgi:hypothetical protein
MSLLPQDQLEQITNALVPTIVTAVVAKLEGQALPQQDEPKQIVVQTVQSEEHAKLEAKYIAILDEDPKFVILKGNKETRFIDITAKKRKQYEAALEKYSKYDRDESGKLR